MTSKMTHFTSVGQEYKDFKVTKIIDLHELHCKLIELVHIGSGAVVMHIANDDPENLFCLSFQTIPSSSNGVAHILEHTVLCGSKKFPVKDPFFAMQRRSLNTFMNALTGSDFTCYPAATQIPKDFYNLLDVYIDAVFYPNLNELSFLQEGHRLEFANPVDPNTPLEFKGVVFNEMKGALSSGGSRLNEAISHALFPDITYGVNSGGDPKVIPSLTYQQLCDFHKEFYNPSRCLFFFYGNMPLDKHLDFLKTNVLDEAIISPPLPPIPLQPRFKEPRHIIASYPIAAEDESLDKTLIAFGWLTCHILEQEEILALSILEIVLMETDASLLKVVLLKSGLCKQASCFLDTEITEIPIVLSFKGCNAENAGALEALVRKTLEDIVIEGIPLNAIDNAIHQLEFFRSEITGDQAPFGLSLFLRSALLMQHGGDAENGLKIHSLFDKVRQRNIEDPCYFGKLIKKHFLDNPHFARIVLVPDKTLAAQELDEERETLATIKNKLTPEQAQEIVAKAAELVAFQKKQEEMDLDVLPTLSLKDVPHSPKVFSLQHESFDNLNVYHHSCFTNEIVYVDLAYELPEIAEEDLSYARLLTTLMSQMSCNGRNYMENLEYIQANTGGVGAGFSFNLRAENNTKFTPTFNLKGKALHRKTSKLFSLLGEMISYTNINDKERLREIIHKQYIALQSTLSQNSLKYAINLSATGLDVPAKIGNHWYGLEYFWNIEKLAKNFDAQADWLIAKLNTLKEQILGIGKPDLIITCDAAMYDEIKGNRFYGLQNLESKTGKKWKGNYPLEPIISQGRIIASPIAFIGKVLKTVPYTHPDAPYLGLAAGLMDNLFLHTSLREQGGAYGGGAVSNAMSATFYFYTYRDPNIHSSMKAFEDGVKSLLEGDLDDIEIEEAKLEMIQGLDMPAAPGSRGDIAYAALREGRSLEIRQAFRDCILSATKEDIIGSVARHVAPQMEMAATIVFAGKELLEKENNKLIARGVSPLPLKTI
jgi:Zn-dependent M16 (insulinase) family peptidase